jgi:hypothetical protein
VFTGVESPQSCCRVGSQRLGSGIGRNTRSVPQAEGNIQGLAPHARRAQWIGKVNHTPTVVEPRGGLERRTVGDGLVRFALSGAQPSAMGRFAGKGRERYVSEGRREIKIASVGFGVDGG